MFKKFKRSKHKKKKEWLGGKKYTILLFKTIELAGKVGEEHFNIKRSLNENTGEANKR